VFKKSYKVALWDEFIQSQTENRKEHTLENYADGFVSQLLLNSRRPYIAELKKRSIYTVNFGVNIGSEINGLRPALIYTRNEQIV
jgi:hypothetical protein